MSTRRLAAVLAASFKLPVRPCPWQVHLNPRLYHIVSRSGPRSAFTTTARQHAVAQETETPPENDERTPSEDSGHEEKDTSAIARSNEGCDWDKQKLAFKQLMRTVPHPIAVVTTHASTAESNEDAVIGATVSSFNTVSLDPDLVVSFNLSSDSATYRTIIESKHFCVSLPVNNQAGAILADRFIQGNDPPPLSRELQPSIQALYWNDLADSTSTTLKHYPPAVHLRDKSLPTGDAGFAFAFLCRYQNSLPVGDKVIVTGRLIPHLIRSSKNYGWGYNHDHDHGNSYAYSHTTMAYVHGNYGTTDNGWGIDSAWKLGDPYRKTDIATANENHVEAMLNGCRKRIDSIRFARLLHQGIKLPELHRTPKQHELRASELPLAHLDDLEAYFAERLALIEARKASSEAKIKAPIDLSGWQNSLLRKKMLLNEQELKKEEALYVGRLRRLGVQSSVLERSQSEAAQRKDQDEDKPSAQSEELTRINELATHVRERLDVVREAQRRKKGGTPSVEIKRMNTHQITRFLESKRQLGYEALKKDYRRDLFQIQEARLSLLELGNRPGVKDEEAVEKLKERVSYYTEAAELIAKLIVERVTQADPMELNAMIRRPLHGMEGPPPRPEHRQRKINFEARDADRPTKIVRGIKDDEGNFTISLKEAPGKPDTEQTTQATRTPRIRIRQGMDQSMARELEEAHASQVAARHNPSEHGRSSNVKDNEGQDYLVMRHYEGEEIPTWPQGQKTR